MIGRLIWLGAKLAEQAIKSYSNNKSYSGNSDYVDNRSYEEKLAAQRALDKYSWENKHLVDPISKDIFTKFMYTTLTVPLLAFTLLLLNTYPILYVLLVFSFPVSVVFCIFIIKEYFEELSFYSSKRKNNINYINNKYSNYSLEYNSCNAVRSYYRRSTIEVLIYNFRCFALIFSVISIAILNDNVLAQRE